MIFLDRIKKIRKPTAFFELKSLSAQNNHNARLAYYRLRQVTGDKCSDTTNMSHTVIPQTVKPALQHENLPSQCCDHYHLLGVSQNASPMQIREAAQQQLNKIRAAYQVLSNGRTRQSYDARLNRKPT